MKPTKVIISLIILTLAAMMPWIIKEKTEFSPLSLDDALWFYNSMPRGTPVIITD
ncbi:hypothetical protein [Tepidanaerobacter syntrophicus]|uniref:hypothetical protein n=1 Tax=Tepidanaerobacter syntrophicus TaxID=224999 RepID=UPI001BD5CA47|nr:hypothetical protein [Tepidanaerobacter syntrophicus]